jgi:hypothetical protein
MCAPSSPITIGRICERLAAFHREVAGGDRAQGRARLRPWHDADVADVRSAAGGVATRRVICAKNAADAYAWWDAPLSLTVRKGTATWNPGSIPAGGRESTPVTVTGAATTDVAVCGFSTIGGTSDVLRCVAQVTAADTCEATLHNVSTATGQDLGSGTVTCVVMTT